MSLPHNNDVVPRRIQESIVVILRVVMISYISFESNRISGLADLNGTHACLMIMAVVSLSSNDTIMHQLHQCDRNNRWNKVLEFSCSLKVRE